MPTKKGLPLRRGTNDAKKCDTYVSNPTKSELEISYSG